MCNTDETTSLRQEEGESMTADSCDGEKEKKEVSWPSDPFKTVLGKMVHLVGKPQSSSLALVSYGSSKIQGNALVKELRDEPSALLAKVNAMFDGGFLNDENGNEIDSLVLPIDAFSLQDGLKGIIIDCDLRGYENGVPWLLNPSSSHSLVNVLRAVGSFVKAMSHLHKKNYCWTHDSGPMFEEAWPGPNRHQFFFNAEYGSFRFVYDWIDIKKDQGVLEGGPSHIPTFEGVAEIIMFLLIGAWPKEGEKELVMRPVSDEPSAFWDSEANELCGSEDAVNSWNALPAIIRDALFKSCLAEPRTDIALDEWTRILEDAIADIDKCVFCGGDVFKTGQHCLHCGKTTKKDGLLTKWSIHNDSQSGDIRVSFGRGPILPGELLGIPSGMAPFMRIMYNPKTNLLGIKNASGIRWSIARPVGTEELAPGAIAPIEKDMAISFEGHSGIEMRFLGYEI